MTQSIAFRRLATLAPTAACLACATGHRSAMPADDRARAASDVPAAFTFLTPVAGDACRNPAVDPRDQTRLVLVRAANGRGDYSVAAGRYGVAAGDLLRLTCATGRRRGDRAALSRRGRPTSQRAGNGRATRSV